MTQRRLCWRPATGEHWSRARSSAALCTRNANGAESELEPSDSVSLEPLRSILIRPRLGSAVRDPSPALADDVFHLGVLSDSRIGGSGVRLRYRRRWLLKFSGRQALCHLIQHVEGNKSVRASRSCLGLLRECKRRCQPPPGLVRTHGCRVVAAVGPIAALSAEGNLAAKSRILRGR